jgi:phage tail sheath protein FI
MPEYLAPGVYVEEVSFRSKSIEGVSTTTTGFIGPARYGPTDEEPDVVTSLGEFQRVYGDGQRLVFADGLVMHNYLWHAARSFFEEGGQRLYVQRVFRPAADDNDGYASATLGPAGRQVRLRARYPGAAGNMRLRFTLRLGPNVLGGTDARPTADALRPRDVAWVSNVPGTGAGSPPSEERGEFLLAESYYDTAARAQQWRLNPAVTSPPASPPGTVELATLAPNTNPMLSDKVRVITLALTTVPTDANELPQVWDGLPLDPHHELNGSPDSLFHRFEERPANAARARSLPVVITASPGLVDGVGVLDAILNAQPAVREALRRPTSSDEERTIEIVLAGGNDGARPTAAEYEGEDDPATTIKSGLKAFEDIEDISILAAPGSTFGYENGYGAQSATILGLLISHAERMRYRIAVLDSGDGQSIAQVRAMRGRIDSKYAAFYYPWIRLMDPITQQEITVPPSGSVAGIYARNDRQRAVYKAPANEVVNLAAGFEVLLNRAQQDILNPEGINCFRFFEGRGFRLWGARTATSDPEWKYVNLRRYFAYLERSIDRGTQWAVFEPNGEQLWANVRRTIEDFLFNEWQMGALLGDKPEKAYFVRVGFPSTMTQNDLDNGRLICLIGVAPLRPAEFVIFRIGQWTGDRR